MMTPPEHDAREAVLNARFQAWSTAAAFIVTTMGTVVLVGWVLGSETLKRVEPGLPAMNPATAIGFILSGFALALLRESDLTPGRRMAAQLLGMFVFTVGTAKIAGTMAGVDLGLDSILFRPDVIMTHSGVADRMAPSSALIFMLFGLALVYFGGQSRLTHRLSQVCSTLGTVLSLIPLTGYLYGAPALQRFASLTPMAMHAAISFVVLGTGLLIAPGTQGIKLVSRADQGGAIVRRFFPSIVGTILALGYLSLQGQRAGWFAPQFGAALMAVGTIVALAALLWWNAGVISRADRRRLAVEAALQLSESALRAANEALALQVRTDSLTMVRNRMALDEELLRAIQNLHRYEAEIFSVLMIDVDYFKRYNDTFGHLAGDDVLREAARLLETTCRTTDIVGRYGGEEFTIILPHTTEQGSREIAERLRATVDRHSWPHAPITVSIGVATASPATVDADEILNEADVALYLAKQNGRNRVYHALDTALPAEA
ncbi:MAG: GGDEF domain-containing protein [Gemmatimonadaceae bacterium]|nr:GGDEF domain-containing protein [Gemmatimonadaceae bacterium]